MPRAERLDADLLREWPLPLDSHGDKHSRGTVLVIAGSSSTAGAALLAGMAALRMGAGRLQVATVAPIAPGLSIALPEAMVIALPGDDPDCVDPDASAEVLGSAIESAQAILLGPGMNGRDAVRALLGHIGAGMSASAVLVADAAALSALGKAESATVDALAGRLVLTPNRQEMRALLGLEMDDDRPDAGALAAKRFGATVTCFDRIDAHDGRSWQADEATPGLGTSGSGDVLAGLVTGAAARSGDPAQAACWATYVHGMSGNRLSGQWGTTSFLARDLLDAAPYVLADLEADR